MDIELVRTPTRSRRLDLACKHVRQHIRSKHQQHRKPLSQHKSGSRQRASIHTLDRLPLLLLLAHAGPSLPFILSAPRLRAIVH